MIPVIAALISSLASQGLGMLGNAVLAKGKDVVEKQLGVNIEDSLGTEEGRIKLKQLEIEHEEFLVSAAQKKEEQELEVFKAEVEDRGSARKANAEVAVSAAAPWYQKALLPMMALVIVVGFFGATAALFYLSAIGAKLDDNSRDVLIYAFGILSAGFGSVVAFLFGSSAGSRDNQAALQKIAGGQK
jgi:hypothetical protein